MSSERGSSAMDRKEIQLCLENGSVKIKGYPNLSVSTEDPQLKASDLYEAIFKDIEKPTEVIVTPERDIDSNPVKALKLLWTKRWRLSTRRLPSGEGGWMRICPMAVTPTVRIETTRAVF